MNSDELQKKELAEHLAHLDNGEREKLYSQLLRIRAVDVDRVAREIINHVRTMLQLHGGKIQSKKDYVEGYIMGLTNYLVHANHERDFFLLPLTEKNWEELLGKVRKALDAEK